MIASPVAVNDLYSVVSGTTLSVAAPGVLTNDTVDLARATILLSPADSHQVSHGTLSFSPHGSYQYRPQAGFQGQGRFVYLIRQDFYEIQGQVTINVLADANRQAVPRSYWVLEDHTLVVHATNGVLANDLPGSGEKLQAVLVSGPRSVVKAGIRREVSAPQTQPRFKASFFDRADDEIDSLALSLVGSQADTRDEMSELELIDAVCGDLFKSS